MDKSRLPSIDHLLQELSELISSGKVYCQFEEGADPGLIQLFEEVNKVSLPEAYKAFLLQFNGGFIGEASAEKLLEKGWTLESYRPEIVLFSIGELIAQYEYQSRRRWKIQDDSIQPYPIVPFCSAPNSELLVFVCSEKAGTNSPVFDAFHEEPTACWGVVADDFTTFLSGYIRESGSVYCVGDESKAVAKDFF